MLQHVSIEVREQVGLLPEIERGLAVRQRNWVGAGAWSEALPAGARRDGDFWQFESPKSGIEPLLKALIDGGAGIEELSIERPGLHDAFVAIAGEAAAREMEKPSQTELEVAA